MRVRKKQPIIEQELALQAKLTHEDFRILADNVDQCLFISAPELSKHYYVSPVFEKIWGIPVSEVYAKPTVWAESILPEHKQRVADYVSRLKGFAMPVEPEIEFQICRADGKVLWLLVNIFAVVARSDGAHHICGSVTDLTEKKDAEKRVSDFYLNISHELRTPLTSIKGALILLERRHSSGLSDAGKELAGLARKECDRLIGLISDMLDLRSIEAGMLQLHLEDLDPSEIITQSESLSSNVASERNIEFVNDIQTSSKITADKDRAVQVLNNLLSNAIKFSERSAKVIVRAKDNDSMVRFSVIDSGCGISPEEQEKLIGIFQKINHSTYEGKGLGLAISKGLIVEHGGQIGMSSQKGKGATFWFDMPKALD